jgi:hypothetical protein
LSDSNKRAKIEDVSVALKTSDSPGKQGKEPDVNSNEDGEDDVDLALEMIETALHILLSSSEASSESNDNGIIQTPEQNEWTLTQISRFLICLGDVYGFRQEHGNAVDAYIRALSYREDRWKEIQESKDSTSIEQLQCRRLYIEACALVAEALLACPDGEDVVCDGDDGETVTYAKATDRVDFALSWFEVARQELDELCKFRSFP